LLISAIPFHEAHPTRAIAHAKYTKFRTDPEAARLQEAKERWEREHPPTPPGVIPTPGEGGPYEFTWVPEDPLLHLSVPQAYNVVIWMEGGVLALDIVHLPFPLLEILKEIVTMAAENVLADIRSTAGHAAEQNSCLTYTAKHRYGMYGVVIHYGLTIGIPPFYIHYWTEQGKWANYKGHH
jgi:hypothetical protein